MHELWVQARDPLPSLDELVAFLGPSVPVLDVLADPVDWWDPMNIVCLPCTPVVRVMARSLGDRPSIRVQSKDERLVTLTAWFMATRSRGVIARSQSGPYGAPGELPVEAHAGFDLAAAEVRTLQCRRRIMPILLDLWPELARLVPADLVTSRLREGRRSLVVRTTHVEDSLGQWFGKGSEYCRAFADTPDLPDGLFACALIAYPVQEWAFVLWHSAGRRFWFGTPLSNPIAAGDLDLRADAQLDFRRALQLWQAGEQNVLVLAG